MSRILDEFGRPAHKNPLSVPGWLTNRAKNSWHDWAAERRVRILRADLAFAGLIEPEARIGTTIRVRVPKRYRR